MQLPPSILLLLLHLHSGLLAPLRRYLFLQELKVTSTRNPRETLLDKNAGGSVAFPPSAPRSRGRQRRTPEGSRNFMYAAHHAVHHERSDVFDDENHVLEGARSPMCASQRPEEDAHGVGNINI